MTKGKNQKSALLCSVLGLAVILAVGASPCRAAAKQAEPVQTELDRRGETALVINTAAEMVAFASSVTEENDYYGKRVVLGNDIVFDETTSKNYKPIVNFYGTFDGQGHSISGIKMAGATEATLFSSTYGTIQNVTIKDCQFISDQKTAGFVDYNRGIISNCTVVDTTITSKENAGGVVSDNCGIVDKCEVINTQIKGGGSVGGIAGYTTLELYVESLSLPRPKRPAALSAEIGNSYVIGGSVSGSAEIGGLIGYAAEAPMIFNCASNCEIIPLADENIMAGGIVGKSGSLTAENCYYSGKITLPDLTSDAARSRYIGSISGVDNGASLLLHCYALNTVAPEKIGNMEKGREENEIEVYDAAYMQSQAFVDQLNANRTSDDWLFWEIRSYKSPYPLTAIPVKLTDCEIAPVQSCSYTGKAQTPDVEITYNGYKLVKDVDYTLKYANNVEMGTATVEISGKGGFTGTVKRDFLIDKPEQTFKYTASYVKAFAKGGFDLNVKRIKGKGALTYTSSNKKVVTVDKKGHVTMKNIGKAQITVKAAETEDYKATSVEISITVKPAKVKLTSVQVKGGRIIAKWNMASHVKGYQIQYSTSKKFKSGVKQAKIKKKTKVSYKSKKIKKGKTYYVRVRAYKGNLYGAWSKKVKIKG